jgi:uncharacterized protein (DUF302 family)
MEQGCRKAYDRRGCKPRFQCGFGQIGNGGWRANTALEVAEMLAGGTIRYSVPEPFEPAIESVCNSLRNRGMRLAGQMDVSGRLQRSLGIALAPCRLLFVLPEPARLTVEKVHPRAAIFLPLHVVISGNDCFSEIHIPNRIQAVRAGPPAPYGPVLEAHGQLLEAVEAVASRLSILA